MSATPITAMIMAGGTGGHVFPALAVAERLRALGHGVCWLGTREGIEARLIPPTGIAVHWIEMRGLRGKGLLRLLSAPLRLLTATLQALRAMRAVQPDVVLGMGGYVAAPGGIAARLLGKPLVIHEQNAAAGLTNRSLRHLAKRVLLGFEGALPGGELVGNPVRESFLALPSAATRYAQRSGPIRVLVVGGSQGARVLNQWLPQALAVVGKDLAVSVRHQGGATIDIARRGYEDAGIEAEVLEFIDDIAEAYAWADLLVCRAGAMTVAEVAASGCAALFVPFAAAVDDHQTRNAQALVDAGAARLIQERDLKLDALVAELRALLANRAVLAEMAGKAQAYAHRDALDRIVQVCLEASS